MTKSKKEILFGALILWLSLVGVRWALEKDHAIKSRNTVIGFNWDPRNVKVIDRAVAKRESEAFKEQSYSGKRAFVWPALRSFQVSWTWLQLLQGLHIRSSSEGDYSWMFSKLNFIAQETPKDDIRLLTGLASFFLVIGTDSIGANLLLREMHLRGPTNWQVWFWSGYHALENLKDNKLAGAYMEKAALLPNSPSYLAPLSVRLSKGDNFFTSNVKRKLLESELPKEIVEKILKFKDPVVGH